MTNETQNNRKFCQINEDGFPIAFYSPEYNPTIPSDAFEITYEQWLELINNSGLRKIINDEVVVFQPPIDPNAETLNQIYLLESTITARRLREAVLGTDAGWLADVESQIEVLRGQLV